MRERIANYMFYNINLTYYRATELQRIKMIKLSCNLWCSNNFKQPSIVDVLSSFFYYNHLFHLGKWSYQGWKYIEEQKNDDDFNDFSEDRHIRLSILHFNR